MSEVLAPMAVHENQKGCGLDQARLQQRLTHKKIGAGVGLVGVIRGHLN